MAHLVTSLVMILVAVGASGEGGAPPGTGEGGFRVVAVPLKNLNAGEAARTLREVFGIATTRPAAEIFVITAETDTNTLVVAGTEPFCQTVLRMATEMDNVPAASPYATVDVTLYQIQLPTEKLATLSMEELQAAATDPAGFYKHLSGLGECSVNGRLREQVNLRNGAELNSGASVPFLTGSQVLKSGQRNTSIEYRDIGNKVRISGAPSASGGGSVSLKIETSALPKSDVEIGDSIRAPAFQKFVLVFDGHYESGRPIVTVSSNPINSSNTKAMLGVARVVLTPGETGK